MRQGRYDDAELERQLDARGLMNRFLGGYAKRDRLARGRCTRSACSSGSGFDTATEVALLVLAGSAVVGGLPFYAVISLPILFAAGMCLFDTIDGCFMNFAYDWAFAKPIRKIYYNLTITGLSVFIALFIGTIEILGLIAQETNLSGGFWDFVAELQHQPGRVHHRRRLRGDLDRGARHLALRRHRAQMGDAGRPGLRERRDDRERVTSGRPSGEAGTRRVSARASGSPANAEASITTDGAAASKPRPVQRWSGRVDPVRSRRVEAPGRQGDGAEAEQHPARESRRRRRGGRRAARRGDRRAGPVFVTVTAAPKESPTRSSTERSESAKSV